MCSNSTQNSLVLKQHMTFVNGVDMSVQLFSLHLQNSADGAEVEDERA